MSEEQEKQITRTDNPMFFKMWDIMCVKREFGKNNDGKKYWGDYEIYAKTTKDVKMFVWNGNHNPTVEANTKEHICPAGTKVRVWMVSRFGDAGITDNLITPKGYDVRGIDADTDLTDYEFIEIKK